MAKIVFVARENLVDNVYVINADGTGRQKLTDYDSDTLIFNPAWSPDKTQITFHYSRKGADRSLRTINLQGETVFSLPSSDGSGYDDLYPAWSPDGTKIAYESQRGIYSIYVINIDGTNDTQLTENDSAQEEPHWSADGTKIAYTSRAGIEGNGRFEIFTMNADGSNKVRLTVNPNSDDREPRWSPDGSKILFTSLRNGEPHLYVMSADGSDVRQITTFGIGNPDWSPDGASILFTATGIESGTLGIFAVPFPETGMIDSDAAAIITDEADAQEFSGRWIR